MTRKKFQNNFRNSKNTNSYDYKKEGEVFKKTISPAFYKSTMLSGVLDELSKFMVHIIESVKRINRQYIYSVSNDDEIV
jgi:hypothetical protein